MQKTGQAFAQKFILNITLAVTTGNDDLNIFIQLAQFTKGLFTTHVGHGQIENNTGDICRMLAIDLQSLHPIFRQ